MKFTPEQVRALAGQARLGLGDEEAERVAAHLAGVRRGAARLKELDVEGVERTLFGVQLLKVWRDDAVEASRPRGAALAAAPDVQHGFAKVPRTVEERRPPGT